jgi:hypothetical protein
MGLEISYEHHFFLNYTIIQCTTMLTKTVIPTVFRMTTKKQEFS